MSNEKKNRSPTRGDRNVTTVYLDSDSRQKLNELAEESGQSKSQVIRVLIQSADGKRYERIAKIVDELQREMGTVLGS